MVVPSFPIHSLPTRPLETVLQSFTYFDMIKYSFISKVTKKVVRSFNLPLTLLAINVINRVHLRFNVENVIFTVDILHTDPNGTLHIEITYENVKRTIRNLEGYSVRSVIEHFMAIFDRVQVDTLMICPDANLLDGQFLKNNLNGFSYNSVLIICERTGYKVSSGQVKALEPFLKSERLYLVEAPFDRPNSYRLLIQNWGQLFSGSYNGLNDLLLSNSSYIEIQEATLSDNDLNIFLKNWRNGSNPRLEHAQIDFRHLREFDFDIILDGIEYQPHPDDEWTHQRQIAVQKNNGTKAMIKYKEGIYANFEVILL